MATVRIPISLGLELGATIDDAAKELLANAPDRAKEGWRLVGLSHAFGPVHGKDQWSILAFYEQQGVDQTQ